jgi:hypothetical protein
MSENNTNVSSASSNASDNSAESIQSLKATASKINFGDYFGNILANADRDAFYGLLPYFDLKSYYVEHGNSFIFRALEESKISNDANIEQREEILISVLLKLSDSDEIINDICTKSNDHNKKILDIALEHGMLQLSETLTGIGLSAKLTIENMMVQTPVSFINPDKNGDIKLIQNLITEEISDLPEYENYLLNTVYLFLLNPSIDNFIVTNQASLTPNKQDSKNLISKRIKELLEIVSLKELQQIVQDDKNQVNNFTDEYSTEIPKLLNMMIVDELFEKIKEKCQSSKNLDFEEFCNISIESDEVSTHLEESDEENLISPFPMQIKM